VEWVIAGTLIALAAAIFALYPVVKDYRDRVDVAIVWARPVDGQLEVRFKNRGGSPTVVTGIRFGQVGVPMPLQGRLESGYQCALAGRDIGRIRFDRARASAVCPAGHEIVIAALEVSGKVSEPYQLDRDVVLWLRSGQ
jgi:hypothetical protein